MRLRRGMTLLTAVAIACGGDADEVADTDGTATSLPASVRAPEVEGGVLLITPDRVRAWQQASEPFVLVDARDAVQFAQEHLPGAINIPYVDIRPGAQLPPRNARIVVYCSDAQCPISEYAYRSLESLGFVEIYDMRAGLQGWKSAGYPTVIGNGDDTES